MDKRTYTEADIEHALQVVAGHRGNVARASRELQIAPMTLHQWTKGIRRKETTEKVKAAVETVTLVQRSRLSRKWHLLANAAISQAQATLKDAGPWEAARIAGLSVDKMTALSGSSRPADGPGFTVTLAQYFAEALPPRSAITVVPKPHGIEERTASE